MFELDEKLETELDIDGKIYSVNMAFDNVLKFLKIIQDILKPDVVKIYEGIYQLLGVVPELEIEELHKVFNLLIEHFIYDHTSVIKKEQVDLEGNPVPVTNQGNVYDLQHDAGYIYTSFVQAYQIDLIKEQGKLDWRLFKMLLADLPEKTKFKEVVGIRQRPYPKGKHSAEERKWLRKAKRIYALPDTVFDDEMN